MGGSGDNQDVVFTDGATSGGLILEQFAGTSATAFAYTGKISGFGGDNHSDKTEYIDLSNIASNGDVSLVYSGSLTEGILTVMSNGTALANLDLVGNYTQSNFVLSADGTGGVLITDPVVPNGGTVTNTSLLGNYMASMFVTTAGQGATPIADTTQQQQPQLAHPH